VRARAAGSGGGRRAASAPTLGLFSPMCVQRRSRRARQRGGVVGRRPPNHRSERGWPARTGIPREEFPVLAHGRHNTHVLHHLGGDLVHQLRLGLLDVLLWVVRGGGCVRSARGSSESERERETGRREQPPPPPPKPSIVCLLPPPVPSPWSWLPGRAGAAWAGAAGPAPPLWAPRRSRQGSRRPQRQRRRGEQKREQPPPPRPRGVLLLRRVLRRVGALRLRAR
jgi:hypothetical protein